MLLVHDLTREIYDEIEQIFDLNPIARLEIFTDMMFDECKSEYYTNGRHGKEAGVYSKKGDAPYGSFEMGYFSISQRDQHDFSLMSSLKML